MQIGTAGLEQVAERLVKVELVGRTLLDHQGPGGRLLGLGSWWWHALTGGGRLTRDHARGGDRGAAGWGHRCGGASGGRALRWPGRWALGRTGGRSLRWAGRSALRRAAGRTLGAKGRSRSWLLLETALPRLNGLTGTDRLLAGLLARLTRLTRTDRLLTWLSGMPGRHGRRTLRSLRLSRRLPWLLQLIHRLRRRRVPRSLRRRCGGRRQGGDRLSAVGKPFRGVGPVRRSAFPGAMRSVRPLRAMLLAAALHVVLLRAGTRRRRVTFRYRRPPSSA